SYTAKFEKKAKDERKRYIDLVKKSIKEIIKDEVKSQLPQILAKEVSDYATPVIQSSVTESLENIVLAKSSSQPTSTYKADASLTKFELKNILLDKIQNIYSLKRDREDKDKDEDPPARSDQGDREDKDKDKDEDPPAGSDQGLKKQKTSKDIEPSRGSKSKESNSSSSKGTKSQPKSSRKYAQAEELVFEAADTEMPLNQGDDVDHLRLGNKIAKAGKPPFTFNKLMSTPIDFSAYVLNNPKIENLTQEYLCYKTVNDKLDWTNPEGHEYLFDLSNPLPLIEDQGHQVVPANYFINNNLEYLKGGSLSKKYMTSTTKIKVAKYDTIEGIEDMVLTLWNPVKLAYDKYAIEDQQLYKLVEGDFPRLNMLDIEDMLLLLVQKKLSNLERDDLFDLNMALRMFTRRVVILKQVEDVQLAVESY
ncbi:hypothetical protein Tco_0562643, partial [Tanacetum coccineum]